MTLKSISKTLESNSDDDVKKILIRALLRLSVREDLCLPIMLMMERKRTRMLQLLWFMVENKLEIPIETAPTSHMGISRKPSFLPA